MNIIKTLILIIVLMSASVTLIFGSRFIPIKQIVCINQYGKCSELIVNDLEAIENSNLFDSKKSVKENLQSSVLVKEYSLHFEFPDTLEVNLIERKARFALVDNVGNSALIDKSGLVLSYADRISVPKMIVVGNLPNVGNKVVEKQLFALEVVYDMNSLYQVKFAEMKDDELVIEFGSGPNVLFPLEGDKEKLVGALILILSKLDTAANEVESNNKNIQTVDLRYANPVLR